MTTDTLGATRESSISVAVRVRPFTVAEEAHLVLLDNGPTFMGDASLSSDKKPAYTLPRGIRKLVNVVDDKMLIFDPPETNPLSSMQTNAFPNAKPKLREYRFVFDKLFDLGASQDDVYCATTRPLLDSILDGYNATVFAYGATGCGKTHTISGTPDDPGVIFLTMKELFERIELLRDTKIIELSLSFLEIYNETIRDLLNPDTSCKKLVLREDANKKILVSNLSLHKPESVHDVMEMILQGNQNRTSSPTEANATSSRSHAVLQINVMQKNRTADLTEEHTFATLSIIDLAGSERAAATKNRGARLNEGANINKSLLALGNCINALCDPRRRNHIPYRDLKLTRLLKFSLGGNCKTVMIVCISPSSQHYDETLNTLKYADRAKEIKTKLIRNQHNLDRHVGLYLKMITEQKQEIMELRAREQTAVEAAIAKHKATSDKCMDVLLELVDTIKKSLDAHQQEKWRKYFLLAKRRLLLVYHVNISILSGELYSKHTTSIQAQVGQLKAKIDQQIIALEKQFDAPGDIDNILNNSVSFTVKRLTETEGWAAHHTTLFERLVEAVRHAHDRDILTNLSILFDYLVHEVHQFNFIPYALARLVEMGINEVENVHHVMEEISSAIDTMNSADFDQAVEHLTSSFIQRQFNATSIPSGPQKRGVSPSRKYHLGKKVRLDDTFESDVSMDESMIQRSDDDLPLGASILDRDLDDLDLPFDPSLDLPKLDRNDPRARRLASRTPSLTHRRLPTSDDHLKPPLLNKQALTKIVDSEPLQPLANPAKVFTYKHNTATRHVSSSSNID